MASYGFGEETVTIIGGDTDSSTESDTDTSSASTSTVDISNKPISASNLKSALGLVSGQITFYYFVTFSGVSITIKPKDTKSLCNASTGSVICITHNESGYGTGWPDDYLNWTDIPNDSYGNENYLKFELRNDVYTEGISYPIYCNGAPVDESTSYALPQYGYISYYILDESDNFHWLGSSTAPAQKQITVSESSPGVSDGNDGDVWITVTT